MKLILQTLCLTAFLIMSGQASAQCSGLTTLTQNSASFDDGSGSLSYSSNSSCTWLIQPANGGIITLNFDSFILESGFDYVRVYDGNSSSATLLGSYTGTTLPSSLTSSGSALFLSFTTDGSVVRDGWSVSYSSCSFSKPTIVSSGTDLCNQNILLATVSASGFSYQWVKDNSLISGANSTSYSTNSVGNYKVNKTDGTCTVSSDVISITSSLPTYSISTANTTICDGTSALLSVTFSSLYSYQWLLDGVQISGATGSSYNALVSGDYSVLYTRNSDGCSNETDAVTINTLPTPAKPIITPTGSLELCNSSNPLILTSNTAGVWNTNETTLSILANQAGSYFLTSTNGVCSVNSDTITVTDNSPNANINSDYSEICSGGTMNLSAPSAVTIFDDFSSTNTSNWSVNTGTYTSNCQSSSRLFFESSTSIRQVISNFIDLSSGASISLSMEGGLCEPLTSGEEIVLQISTNNGSSWTDLLVFPLTTGTANYSYTLPANSLNSNAKIRVYQRTHDGNGNDTWSIDDFSINVNGALNNYTYAWSPASSLSSTTAQNTVATINGPTVIGLTVTDPTTGCSNSSVKAIQVNNDYLEVSLSSDVTTICEGESVDFYGSTFAPSYSSLSYSWSSNGEVLDTDTNYTSGTLFTTQLVSLQITDDNTGCNASDAIGISVSQTPSIPQITTTGSLCNSNSVTLSGDGVHNWSNGITGSSISISTPGSYFASNTSGACTSYSDTIVLLDESPQASIDLVNSTICPGGQAEVEAVVLDETNVLSDDFSTSTTSNWSVNTGTYTSNCQSTGRLFFESSTSIRQVISNFMDLSSGATVDLSMEGGVCEPLTSGEEIVLQISSNNGSSWIDLLVFPLTTGTADYSYIIPANVANTNAKVRVYQRTHDGNGNDTWSIDNFSIVSNAVPTSGNYTYSWTPSNLVASPTSASTQTVSLNTSSAINLVVTDQNTGCTSSTTSIIPVSNQVLDNNFSIVSPSSSICSGGSSELSITENGGSSSSVSDDFSSSTTSNWSINNGSYITSCSNVPAGALYFDGSTTRQLVTNTLDLTLGATVSFDFEISACDGAETGESVELQISTDGGNNWTQLIDLGITTTTETMISHSIAPNSSNGSALLRWVQLTNSGSGFDTWYIDDVNININVNSSTSNSNYTYSWSPALSINGSTDQATVTTNALQNTSVFEATITDNTTRCSSTISKILPVVNTDIPVTIANPLSSICEGGSVQLTAETNSSTGSNYSYEWTVNSNNTVVETTVSPVFNNINSTSIFSVTVTDNDSKCTGSAIEIISPAGTSAKPTISRQLDFLICNEYSTGIQWYKDGIEIPFENSQFLNLENTGVLPGCYTVSYSNLSCTTVSDCFVITVTGLEDLSSTSNISANLFPNPATTDLNINISSGSGSASAQVFSVTGQDVTSLISTSEMIELTNGSNELNISSLETGVYIMRITNENNEVVHKFTKE